MRKHSYIILLVLSVQCESLFLNENSLAEVTAAIQDQELIIRNTQSFNVYIFAVDLETSYLIDWAPYEGEENRIMPGDYRVFSTEDILGYEEDKSVVVYIWAASPKYSLTIEINQ